MTSAGARTWSWPTWCSAACRRPKRWWRDTKTSAEILKLDDLGTVATGKSADFLVLDANPLDNILNTRKINKVYQRGLAIDRAAMAKELSAEAAN